MRTVGEDVFFKKARKQSIKPRGFTSKRDVPWAKPDNLRTLTLRNQVPRGEGEGNPPGRRRRLQPMVGDKFSPQAKQLPQNVSTRMKCR